MVKVLEEEREIDDDATTTTTTTSNGENNTNLKKKKKKKQKVLLNEAEKRGVCYLSRIPPHMDHVKLRHILSQFGDIQRIFLSPQGNSAAQVPPKRSRASRDQAFSEGWVEFANKSVAKRVANMLNGEQMGGKKRSSFYYDLWNIKYLSKFKWDDLTEELALKKAVREQKLAVELSAAKRERDFYLSKVDQSRALNAIEERLKKKQKVQQDSGQVTKAIRHFNQTKPIAANAKESKNELSDDMLDAVFGGS
ncbi:pre-rRNA-processing protein ESF2 [Gastrolobium bilobum]|uniref:pre-rRNA-processing protein ESF2 n=1 Tax=Gastrolobium bilobum TaxID=150636 RepID=UPI002AB145B9|nr:pre-rRNA-processing protein ESF2 [Gastrolobium bilobum]